MLFRVGVELADSLWKARQGGATWRHDMKPLAKTNHNVQTAIAIDITEGDIEAL